MNIWHIVNMFKYGNVCVSGKRGRGKDLLTANVVIRRKKPYISNINYGGEYIPFNYEDINIGTSYQDFLDNKIKQYKFPYEDGTDIYLSDTGVYFPAQYCSELDRKYKSLPVYMALSRHISLSNFHTNCQAFARVYNKIREQSDQYILCRKCFYLGKYIPFLKIVFQQIGIYERMETAEESRLPLKIPLPFLASREQKTMKAIKLAEYKAQHGMIAIRWLIYWNKSKYNTRHFKEILERGTPSEKSK